METKQQYHIGGIDDREIFDYENKFVTACDTMEIATYVCCLMNKAYKEGDKSAREQFKSIVIVVGFVSIIMYYTIQWLVKR